MHKASLPNIYINYKHTQHNTLVTLWLRHVDVGIAILEVIGRNNG